MERVWNTGVQHCSKKHFSLHINITYAVITLGIKWVRLSLRRLWEATGVEHKFHLIWFLQSYLLRQLTSQIAHSGFQEKNWDASSACYLMTLSNTKSVDRRWYTKDYEALRGRGGGDSHGNIDVLVEITFLCHFLHLKSPTDWPGIEQGPPLWHTGNLPPEPWHGSSGIVCHSYYLWM